MEKEEEEISFQRKGIASELRWRNRRLLDVIVIEYLNLVLDRVPRPSIELD